MALAKPYVVTNPAQQGEDIDHMFDELYRAFLDLESAATSTTGSPGGPGSTGVTLAQVSARVLHEL